MKYPKDISGMKIGKLTVIEACDYIAHNGKKFSGVKCQCDCGNIKIVRRNDFLSGKSKSCGCLIREFNKTKIRREKFRNKNKDRLRSIWKNMVSRCCNVNFPDYPNYGGRGIEICGKWVGKNGFINFYDWAISNGYSENLTLDRIDNDEGYSPQNCRWANWETQCSNKRTNHYLTYVGITKTATQWAKMLGYRKQIFQYRMKKGLSDEDVLLGIRKDTRERNKIILDKYLEEL